MKTKILLLLIISQTVFSQMKTIQATSLKVDIRDGKEFKKGNWTITPKLKPDVYETYTKKGKIVFYTDLDSIIFEINSKIKEYNFAIILNKKDTAYTQIKCVNSKLEILKNAEKYNYDDTRSIPNFTYQDMNNPNLVKIRTDLKLDSIAGTGNEISKIINLLHWVHNTIRHDGSSSNPKSRNTLDLISVCKKENRGVNCRMLATILNECYLSLGFKSRYVTCMPRETEFEDCHVINMVYSNELSKWIWVDPTNDAYVMDENGVLLNLEEVRERLINHKPLILNPDANWNRKSSVSKEYYLEYYMAKNLYRMQCPLVSEYDSETWNKGKEVTYIELLPLDGIEQTPQKEEQINKQTGVKFINYKTNNPNLFWIKP